MARLHCDEYTREDRDLLLRIARESIISGCAHAKFQEHNALIERALTSGTLAESRSSFVTLMKTRKLRGCIGTLEPRSALPLDVAANAFKSAFHDPRFPALSLEELNEVTIEIAVLSLQTAIAIKNEADLLRQLKPNVDGLTIDDGRHRATFLPKVWESLPQPDQFLTQLKIKAGMSPDYWSPAITAYRYHAESFSEAE